MAMIKSIGRTLPQIDVAANTSVRIHEEFFNSHSSYHHVSQSEIDALAQRIVEIIVEIVVRTGELQGLKPEF